MPLIGLVLENNEQFLSCQTDAPIKSCALRTFENSDFKQVTVNHFLYSFVLNSSKICRRLRTAINF